MIISVASAKGSPGVTTLTAMLAWLWPDTEPTRLIVEADPSGGSLAARWHDSLGVTLDPGLIALSAARAQLDSDTLATTSQPIAEGLRIVCAPPLGHQVAGSLNALGDRGAAELASRRDVAAFVDCGRINGASPAVRLARRSTQTVLVCRPRLDEVQILANTVPELRATECSLGLVCVGAKPYAPAEVADRLGLPLLGTIAEDANAAALLGRDGFAVKSLRRSQLAKSVSSLATTLQARSIETLIPLNGSQHV